MYNRFIAYSLLLLVLQACTGERLQVKTEYLSEESLASYAVQTPDPQLINPPVGQRLVISWFLPQRYLTYSDLHLNIVIRFGNHEQITQNVPVKTLFGYHIYSIVKKNFFEKEGIQTYKIDLIGNGQVLEEWRHQLWVELITFEE